MPNRRLVERNSHTMTKDAMKAWLKEQYDIPAAQFDETMRSALPKENVLQAAILRWLRTTYPTAFIWKAAAGPYTKGGIPDICAVIDGQFFAFEVKRPYIGVLSKLQEVAIEQIKMAGGNAAVISFPEQAEEVITNAKRREEPRGSESLPPAGI